MGTLYFFSFLNDFVTFASIKVYVNKLKVVNLLLIKLMKVMKRTIKSNAYLKEMSLIDMQSVEGGSALGFLLKIAKDIWKVLTENGRPKY